jgi:formate hydrogenlyase subunit 6/NADH:ubiquinone oxidoreductase subunit I
MAYQHFMIDYEKCITPYACKKCLQICPQAVFAVKPVKTEKFKETDKNEPGSFKLTVDYGDKCTVCNQCVEICPVNALKVTYE